MKKPKKVFSLSVCLILFSLSVCSCSNNNIEQLVNQNAELELEDEQETSEYLQSESPEIVCWGDSMTAGNGVSDAVIETEDTYFDASGLAYPEILEQLTGYKTYNYGVSGATSEEIAVMQGGLFTGLDLEDYEHIDSDIMTESKEHKGDILILEIGSNGGWNGEYETLIEQYRAMIFYSGCDKYIIIGDTDDPINSVDELVSERAQLNKKEKKKEKNKEGNKVRDKETSWETALRQEFGEHFINMRNYLIENGLDIAGLEKTKKDERQQRRGNISKQLRSDWTHFNSYGYYAKAVGVYQKGQELGYWK